MHELRIVSAALCLVNASRLRLTGAWKLLTARTCGATSTVAKLLGPHPMYSNVTSNSCDSLSYDSALKRVESSTSEWHWSIPQGIGGFLSLEYWFYLAHSYWFGCLQVTLCPVCSSWQAPEPRLTEFDPTASYPSSQTHRMWNEQTMEG